MLAKEKEVMDLKREVLHPNHPHHPLQHIHCQQVRAMDKYKFVLNHKIQLLENEIEPKENKIGEMKQQILAMEEELTAVVKDQA